MNRKRVLWPLGVAALVTLLVAGGAFPAIADDPIAAATPTPGAVARVATRVAVLRATRAARYAAIRAASEARITAMLARIEAERATWYVEHVATPTPVEVPRYATNPVLLSPAPNAVYGNRTRATIDVRGDLVPIMGIDAVTGDPMPTGAWEYEWHTETIAVPSGGGVFRWAWEGTLGPDEYFQVQLICPNGSHRGIHPPTKDLLTVQGGCLRYVVQDCKGAKTRAWDHESWSPIRNIPIQWTVAIVRWDGVDPSRIGATLAEAEPRWLRI